MFLSHLSSDLLITVFIVQAVGLRGEILALHMDSRVIPVHSFWITGCSFSINVQESVLRMYKDSLL